MFSKIICLCLVTLCVFAAPPADKVPLEKQQPTVIPIISQSEELESNGTYKFSYETGNGITREEVSYDKVLPKPKNASNKDGHEEDSDESNEIHVQKGSYSYTAPDGSVITVRYIADENGFRPIGDHFPKPPSIAAARSAGKKGRKADLDKEESKSTPTQAKNGFKPNAAPQSPVEAALGSDLNSEPIDSKSKSEQSVTSSSTSPAESSSEPSTTEESGSETSAPTTEASTSETSTTEESNSEISTTDATPEVSETSTTEASSSEASKPEGSTTEASSSEASTVELSSTEALASESSTSDASTSESSTPEESSTTESNTTELASTVADEKTLESSTTTTQEPSSHITSDSSTPSVA